VGRRICRGLKHEWISLEGKEGWVWFGLVGSLSCENDSKEGSSNILNVGFVFTEVVEPLILHDGLFLCHEMPWHVFMTLGPSKVPLHPLNQIIIITYFLNACVSKEMQSGWEMDRLPFQITHLSFIIFHLSSLIYFYYFNFNRKLKIYVLDWWPSFSHRLTYLNSNTSMNICLTKFVFKHTIFFFSLFKSN